MSFRWRQMRLSNRLTVSFVLVIIVTVLIMVFVANRIAVKRVDDLSKQFAQQLGLRLVPALAEYYQRQGSWEGIDITLDTRHLSSNVGGAPNVPASEAPPVDPRAAYGPNAYPIGRLLLYDAEGDLVLDSGAQREPLRVSAKQIAEYGVPIEIEDQQVGTLLIESSLGRLSPAQRAQTQSITSMLLLAGLAATIGVALMSELQTRNILRPVRALVEAANHLAEGDLSQRIPADANDELGEMAEAFNTMAAKLEAQNALRHRTTADIAHELRTPLSVLQIELESLEDGLVEADNAYIAGLKQEVRHLERLIDDLRILSLADAGELVIEHEEIDIAWLVRSTTRRIQDTARNKQLTMSVQIADALPPIWGDGQRLAQVLLNLLANAINHTPPGGNMIVSAAAEPGRAIITVRDTGTGISKADLPHIFERLFRADRSRSRGTGGSGLGLAIAKSLVEAHGGEIWAESTVGEGTTVSFSLPSGDHAAD